MTDDSDIQQHSAEHTVGETGHGSPGLVSRDPAFIGMTATQFLGAFNDNLFKQLVLLLCVDLKALSGGTRDYQSLALALFAIPFVLFSGFAGFLSDRNSKRTIVVLMKVAEIAVMSCGLAAFLVGGEQLERLVPLLFIVLFLMSTQSAFFGPSKYGILPEMFRASDLPIVNGIIQMTTFVAIIFGMALAGFARDWFGDRLWLVSMMCVGLAVAGTMTSVLVRRTAVAHPGLQFRWSAMAVNSETWQMLKADRSLLKVLLIATLFWFIGGTVQPVVNEFGKLQLGLSNGRTSVMAACIGVGIAAGCAVSGRASRKKVDVRFVTWGAWGIAGSLFLLGAIGLAVGAVDGANAVGHERESFASMMIPVSVTETLARLGMASLGFAGGFFVVPLQVLIQTRPPEDQKGRMIGTLNLFNWIGIVLAAGVFGVVQKVLATASLPVAWFFPLLGLIMLPVAVFYRPPQTELVD